MSEQTSHGVIRALVASALLGLAIQGIFLGSMLVAAQTVVLVEATLEEEPLPTGASLQPSACDILRETPPAGQVRCIEGPLTPAGTNVGTIGLTLAAKARAPERSRELAEEAIDTLRSAGDVQVTSVRGLTEWPDEFQDDVPWRGFTQQTALASLSLAVFTLALFMTGSRRTAEATQWVNGAGQLAMLAAGVSVGIGIVAVSQMIIALLPTETGFNSIFLDDTTWQWHVPSPDRVLIFMLLLPLLEEKIFRARLIPALQGKLGMRWAVTGSAAVFAAVHLPTSMFLLLLLFAAGLAFGALYARTGSLIACVAAHSVVNSFAVALG